jgi:2-enoate reductase
MAKMFSKIFEPIRIGSVEIKNRVAFAPLATWGLMNVDGSPNKRCIDYYIERARADVGLIITGGYKVEGELDAVTPGTPIITPAVSAPFGEIAEGVQAFGAKIFVQLAAGFGRASYPHFLGLKRPVSVSAIPNYWEPSITCRELKTEEVEYIVKCYGKAAEICANAGIDGVEVHAVHEGYLLDQFAIAFFNKRTDKYGGDLKGRLRFAIEVIREIKETVGEDYPVSIRFSIKSYIKDWNQGGLPGEQFDEKGRDTAEGLEAAKILEEAGVDAFDADAGAYDSWYWSHPPNYQERGCWLSLTEKLKRVVKVPVIVAGRMDIPELAEKTLFDGKAADMVAIGRGLLADPYWVKKIAEGRPEHIRPCLSCHDGCLLRIALGKPLSCAVNPAAGRESDYQLHYTSEAKNVMIVGGGVAGLEAARVAAFRGHKVTLYEKSNSLGGHLIELSLPDFKRDVERLLDWYKLELKSLNVNIKLNVEVMPDLIEKERMDVVIIATGSRHLVPDVPGIQRNMVATAADILIGRKKVGAKVVIVGGGLIGCETALWLAQQGKKVSIVEKLADIMAGGLPVPHPKKTMLMDLLDFNKVTVITNHSLLEVKEDGAVLISVDFERKNVEADSVVITIGLETDNKELYNSLVSKIPNLYQIGDAREARNIMGAIWDAYEVARAI